MTQRSYDPITPVKAAFLGLGVMGYPMAGHLRRAGHAVTVYNRSAEKADRWAAEHGGLSAPTPRQAAHDADLVFACVGNDDDLRSVVLGEHGAHGILAGSVRQREYGDGWATWASIVVLRRGPPTALVGPMSCRQVTVVSSCGRR